MKEIQEGQMNTIIKNDKEDNLNNIIITMPTIEGIIKIRKKENIKIIEIMILTQEVINTKSKSKIKEKLKIMRSQIRLSKQNKMKHKNKFLNHCYVQ